MPVDQTIKTTLDRTELETVVRAAERVKGRVVDHGRVYRRAGAVVVEVYRRTTHTAPRRT